MVLFLEFLHTHMFRLDTPNWVRLSCKNVTFQSKKKSDIGWKNWSKRILNRFRTWGCHWLRFRKINLFKILPEKLIRKGGMLLKTGFSRRFKHIVVLDFSTVNWKEISWLWNVALKYNQANLIWTRRMWIWSVVDAW